MYHLTVYGISQSGWVLSAGFHKAEIQILTEGYVFIRGLDPLRTLLVTDRIHFLAIV